MIKGGLKYYILFENYEQRLALHDVLDSDDIPNRIAPVCVCGRVSKGKVITRKPIVPGKEELEENSRSKSAKLRVFERRITEG